MLIPTCELVTGGWLFNLSLMILAPKSKLIHDRIGKKMRLGDATDPVMQRDVQRKIQVIWRGYAAGLDLEAIGAEWLKGFGISPGKAEREAILAAPNSRSQLVVN